MRNILVSLLLISSTLAFSQHKKSLTLPVITISGFISDTCIKAADNHPGISYYGIFDRHKQKESEKIPLMIKGNTFSVTIHPKFDVSYLSIDGMFPHAIFGRVFLVQAGDNLHLNLVTPHELRFDGKGSEKMNYQIWMSDESVSTRRLNSRLEPGTKECINWYAESTRGWMNAADKHLRTLSNSCSLHMQELLRITTASAIYWTYFDRISSDIIHADSVSKKNCKEALENLLLLNEGFSLTDAFILKHCYLYTEYLFNLNLRYATLIDNLNKPLLSTIYQVINQHYDLTLRDKVLTYFIIDRYKTYPEAENLIKLIKKNVREPESKLELEMFTGHSDAGIKAFNFQFLDTSGHFVKLSDFKGKVLVIDTWFNGCAGCITLTQQMKPVLQYFKGNENIVFMGLSVDKNKQRFIDGVKSGLYTAKGEVIAYTNGLGEYHPMIRHYQYLSYPNLLLIDKQGNVISTNPPRPSNRNATNQLIKILENNL